MGHGFVPLFVHAPRISRVGLLVFGGPGCRYIPRFPSGCLDHHAKVAFETDETPNGFRFQFV